MTVGIRQSKKKIVKKKFLSQINLSLTTIDGDFINSIPTKGRE